MAIIVKGIMNEVNDLHDKQAGKIRSVTFTEFTWKRQLYSHHKAPLYPPLGTLIFASILH